MNNDDFKKLLTDPEIRRELWMITNRTPVGQAGLPCRPFDIADQLFLIAAQETAEYVIKSMPSARRLATRAELFDLIFQDIQEGLVLEFGVHKGTSINMIATKLPSRQIHGFDSFEGLPEDWNHVPKGVFDLKGEMPNVADNVSLHKGWFDDTLDTFLATHPGNIAFVHIDSDLYSSAKYVLTRLKNRLVEGSIVQFDEFFNYPNWKEGEYRAFR